MSEEETAVAAGSAVSLREIDADTVRTICNLAVREDQQKFVAPNAVSIAQAHFSEYAWFRAVYADDTPVGFLMLYDRPDKPEYYLWRFMIDARYQGMGFGEKAIARLVDYVKTRPSAQELLTSVVQDEGGPQPFYEKLGFGLTGDYEDGEAVMAETAQSVAFLDYFSELEDPRQAGKVLFALDEIMLLVLCGVLSGGEGFVEIARWGEMNLDFLRRFLPYRNAIPDPERAGAGHRPARGVGGQSPRGADRPGLRIGGGWPGARIRLRGRRDDQAAGESR